MPHCYLLYQFHFCFHCHLLCHHNSTSIATITISIGITIAISAGGSGERCWISYGCSAVCKVDKTKPQKDAERRKSERRGYWERKTERTNKKEKESEKKKENRIEKEKEKSILSPLPESISADRNPIPIDNPIYSTFFALSYLVPSLISADVSSYILSAISTARCGAVRVSEGARERVREGDCEGARERAHGGAREGKCERRNSVRSRKRETPAHAGPLLRSFVCSFLVAAFFFLVLYLHTWKCAHPRQIRSKPLYPLSPLIISLYRYLYSL